MGVWFHVFLDAFIYNDLNLFYPIEWNPLQGLLSYQIIINFCLVSLPLALILYLVRATLLGWGKPDNKLDYEKEIPTHINEDPKNIETYYEKENLTEEKNKSITPEKEIEFNIQNKSTHLTIENT